MEKEDKRMEKEGEERVGIRMRRRRRRGTSSGSPGLQTQSVLNLPECSSKKKMWNVVRV